MVAPTAASAVTSMSSKRDAGESFVNVSALLQKIALAAFNVAFCLLARFYSGPNCLHRVSRRVCGKDLMLIKGLIAAI